MSQPKLVMDSGVYASLNVNIIIRSFMQNSVYFKHITCYPTKELCGIISIPTNMNHIRKSIFGFNCERSFENKNVNEMVKIFNETIMF